MIPITVITGFLGGGKTKVLRAVLDDPRYSRAAAILADSHQMALDYYLMPGHPTQRIEAIGNCCAENLHDNVRQAIFDIMVSQAGQTGAFDRILIEAPGTLDPAPLIHTLATDTLLRKRAYLADIICVVDGINGRNTFNTYPVAIKQACFANRIIVTKNDLMTGKQGLGDLTSLVSTLHQYNPKSPIVRWPDKTLDVAALLPDIEFDANKLPILMRHWFQEAGRSPADAAVTERGRAERPEERIVNHWLTMEDPIDSAALDLFMGLINSHRSSDVLRVKGILRVLNDDGRALCVQAEQNVVHAAAPTGSRFQGDGWSRIFVTTCNVSQDSINDLLNILRMQLDDDQCLQFKAEARRIGQINEIADRLAFNDEGLVPVILQDDESKDVLTLTWLDREAIVKALATGRLGSNYQLADFGSGPDGGTVILRVTALDKNPADPSHDTSDTYGQPTYIPGFTPQTV
jgi:G3E family GTPase